MSKKNQPSDQEILLSEKIYISLRDLNQGDPESTRALSQEIASSVTKLVSNPSNKSTENYTDLIDDLNINQDFAKNFNKVIKNINEVYPFSDHKDLREIVTLPMSSKLKEQEVIARRSEFTALNEQEISKTKGTKATVERTLRKTLPDNIANFTPAGGKDDGMSAGLVGRDKKKDLHMLKEAVINFDEKKALIMADIAAADQAKPLNDTIPEEQAKKKIRDELIHLKHIPRQIKVNKKDFVTELIASSLYNIVLPNRSPTEKIVEGTKQSNSIYVASKFLPNAQTISEITQGRHHPSLIDSYSTELKNMYGFENVVAGSQIYGEIDYHGGNLMRAPQQIIVTNNEGVESLVTKNVAMKIDHGKTFILKGGSFQQNLGAMADNFNIMGYSSAILNGNLKFDIDEYSKALKQMTSQLDNNQTENIIDKRIDELKKTGFDPVGMQLATTEYVEKSKPKVEQVTINNFDELGNFYKDFAKQNLASYKEYAVDIDIISKFDKDDEFKSGHWIGELRKSKEQDPLQYAIKNKIKLIDYDPKSGNLKRYDPKEWAAEHGHALDNNNARIKNPIINEPVAAANWKRTDQGKWETTDPDYLSTPPKVDKTTQVTTNEHTQAHPIDPNAIDKITDHVATLVDEFSKNNVNKKIKTENVKKFYDQIYESFKKEGALSDKDIIKIKNSPDYEPNIKETTQLINTNHSKLSVSERLFYCVANVSEKIGLKSIANSIKENLYSDYFKKNPTLKNAIVESIKVSNKLDKNTQIKVEALNVVKKNVVQKINSNTPNRG